MKNIILVVAVVVLLSGCFSVKSVQGEYKPETVIENPDKVISDYILNRQVISPVSEVVIDANGITLTYSEIRRNTTMQLRTYMKKTELGNVKISDSGNFYRVQVLYANGRYFFEFGFLSMDTAKYFVDALYSWKSQ